MRWPSTRSTPRPSPLRCRPRLVWLLLLVGICWGQPPSAEANAQRLREWILRWLGNPPIAAGGSRAGAGPPQPVCLLHPLVRGASPPVDATLAVPRPEIATATPLARIALKTAAGDLLAQEYLTGPAADAGAIIPWPRPWPSLEPGRPYQLVVQSTASSDEATLVLRAGSAQAFQQHRDRVAALGQAPKAWLGELSRLLAGPEPPSEANRVMAASLLFAAEAPPSRELQRLRVSLRRAYCAGTPR
jgi:hypothetical protein